MVATSVPALTWEPILIGRGAELDALASCVPGARSALVFLQGAEGMGRTSLLRAARGRLRADGATVLHATASGPPRLYQVVRDLFTAPETTGADGPSPMKDYPVMAELWTSAMTLMADAPLVLMIDDVSACDEMSLSWLDFALRRAAGAPLSVVLTQRTDATGPGADLVADLVDEHDGRTVRLGSLSTKVMAQIVTRDSRAHPAFVEACVRTTGGNPKLLAALLDELRARSVQPDAAGAWHAVAAGRAILVTSVRERLERLGEPVRSVAEAVAVVDGAGTTTTLGALCGLSDSLVSRSLDILWREELLAADVAVPRDLEVAGAMLAGLSPAGLDDLRRRAAMVLADQETEPEQVARLLAALPRVPAPWMHQVLRRAAAAVDRTVPAAVDTVAGYLLRVLDAVPNDDETLSQLADLIAHCDLDAGLVHLTEALARTGDLRARTRLTTHFAAAAVTDGRTVLAFQMLDRALAKFDARTGGGRDGTDRELRDRARAMLVAVGLTGQDTTGQALARGAAMLTPGDSARSVDGWTVYAAMLAGRDAATVARHARHLLVGRLPESPLPIMGPATALACAGEPAQALAALDTMLARGADVSPARRGEILVARAITRAGLGDLHGAAADARAVMARPREPHGRVERMSLLCLASVLVRMRAPHEAHRLVELAGRLDFGHGYPIAAMTLAEVRWTQGDREGALEILRRCGRRLAGAGVHNPVFAPWWLSAACLLVVLGRQAEAAELAEYGEQTAREWDTTESTGLGLLARGVATPGPRGVDLLAGAVDVLSASPARLTLAGAEHLLGRALLGVDDASGGRTHLRNAISLAVRCGHLTLGTAARDLFIAAGGRMRELSGRRSDVLSDAELRVATRARDGASNRDIAEELFVSLRTVETHLSSVYRKLGISERSDLTGAMDVPSTTRGAQP